MAPGWCFRPPPGTGRFRPRTRDRGSSRQRGVQKNPGIKTKKGNIGLVVVPGPSGHSSPLLASLPIPGRPLHPPLDIKHFLTFRLNGTSPLNLFPNFNTFGAGMNPSTRTSLFGVRWEKGARESEANGLQEPEGECSSLGLTPGAEESPAELSGSVAPLGSPPASELSEGTSDATSVASSAAQAAEAQAAESGSSVSSAPESEKEGQKSKQHLYCPTCKVTVNSLSQLEAHNTGAKHKSMLEGHSTQMRRGRGKLLSRAGHKSKRIGNKGSINIQNKAFHCQVCEIYVNSETQLKQHMNSRRHKDRLAGKPPKPKYSPYNKLQKNAALAVSILKVPVCLRITHPVCSPRPRLPR
ncbi:PREDICTED: zinc finger protein 385C [Charadrius vociferus]|uniref:zinc finger protein 385C n=1 Tax=Charadrius vociferus TaxID=50402 RepID=UPI000521C6C2|nr:PREDICTED: zinc finger protein 385C [Charadrius vociferus]